MKKVIWGLILPTLLLWGCKPAEESLEQLTERVFTLAELQAKMLDGQVPEDRAPKYLEENDSLVTSDMNWWCSGFFPGTLWMIYEQNGNPEMRALAEKNTMKLEHLLDHHTDHDIGFQINNSYGHAYRITGEEKWKPMLLAAGERLASRFNPVTKTLRSWDFVHKGRDWHWPVIIDNMMNLELLTNAARLFDREDLKEIALTHANTTLKNHFRPDYSSYHLVDYDSISGDARLHHTVQGFADESAWARGQAWAVYGYTMMARETQTQRYLIQAEEIARYLLKRLPEDGIPFWDFDSDKIPADLRDASAGAIMASAFAELATLTVDRSLAVQLTAMAEKQVRTLASPDYLAEPGTNGGFLLKHSVGNIPGGTEIDVPLTYADYYFLEALQRLQKVQELGVAVVPQDHPFGPNVFIMRPTDNMDSIHNTVERIHDAMFRQDFGRSRYAILFMPGDYREAGLLKVPFYVHMAGLGRTPFDVQVDNIHTPVHLANDNGTCTFWRSLENLSVLGPETYEEDEMFKWAVSQAAPIRRVYSERNVKNQWKDGWVSGGFTADCWFMGAAGSHGQQQWYTRNTHLEKGRGEFREGSWNYVFQGVELGQGADKATYVNNWDQGGNVTFIPTTSVIREKPFLFVDEKGAFKVFRPDLRRDAAGVSYTRTDMGPGQVLDVKKDFYIVAPGTAAAEINRQLAKGKHLIFQPGMFELEEPLHVTQPNTIVMGLGWSTLIPGKENPASALVVDDVDGVTICSLLFDAHNSSHALLTLEGQGKSHAQNPTLLSDVFFRVGGFIPAPVHVDYALEIKANDVIGDHFWIWRADHGVKGSVGWDINTCPVGLHVTGDDVTIYGLFNEHFQEYQTLWEGERGRTFFYQCETPYDAGYQDRYMSENGTRAGYAAYKVADKVDTHEATALGIYDVYFKTDIRMENSVEVPEKPGIRIFHLCDVSLSDPGERGIGYVINGKVKSTFDTYRVCRPFINEFVGGKIDMYREGNKE